LTQEQVLDDNLPSGNGDVKMRKRHLKWLWILVIFFVGCAAAPVQKTDLSKIEIGCSIEEVKKTIPGVPIVETGLSPRQAVVAFMLSHLDYKVLSTPKTLEILDDLSKILEAEKPGWTMLLYQNLRIDGLVTPYWFIFDNKNKLIEHGEGDEKVANYAWNCMVTRAFRANGFLTYAEAAKRDFKGFLKLEKDNPYMSYFKEIWKHRIMLAEKLDKKEITEKEFDYLTTQKQNEIKEKIHRAIMADSGGNNQGGLTTSQTLMMGWFLSRPHYAPYRPPYIGYGPAGLPIYNPSPY